MQEGKHYLYRHIRLDKNEPFYVGIGTKTKYDFDNFYYQRAYSRDKRNSFWKNIVKKTEYEVEIMLESSDYEFIKTKEIEFIKLYGRRNLNAGTLCNLTDGGDGSLGLIYNESHREALRKARQKSILSGYRSTGKSIFQYDINGNFMKEWDYRKDACTNIGVGNSILTYVANGRNNNYCKGYFWFNEYMGEMVVNQPGTTRNYNTKVIMIDKNTNEELFEFDSLTKACKYFNKKVNNTSNITKAIKNKSIAYGHKWKLKNE